MTARRIFIVLPSLTLSGPVRGAAALANALSESRPVTVVALKPSRSAGIHLDPNVEVVSLGQLPSWPARIRHLQSMLDTAGGRSAVLLVSMGFSADLSALLCRRSALICSSVRGNLLRNYRFDYGVAGWFVAALHLWLLRYFDHVTAMTKSMSRQVARFSGRPPRVIGNFIDENRLAAYRETATPSDSVARVVFVGTLSARKRPDLAIEAVRELRSKGVAATLDIVGNGPLQARLAQQVEAAGAGLWVTLHGSLDDPYQVIARSHCLLLPSHAEGVSRAMLEALYLGVPCVVRNVDGAEEVITNGVNGYLFDTDAEIPDAIRRALALHPKTGGTRPVLVPDQSRQKFAVDRYLCLAEG